MWFSERFVTVSTTAVLMLDTRDPSVVGWPSGNERTVTVEQLHSLLRRRSFPEISRDELWAPARRLLTRRQDGGTAWDRDDAVRDKDMGRHVDIEEIRKATRRRGVHWKQKDCPWVRRNLALVARLAVGGDPPCA
jgi:hypothetical protein